jgi:hypothetical protein
MTHFGIDMWAAIAHTGAWLNLFNPMPICQLDGNRGFAALEVEAMDRGAGSCSASPRGNQRITAASTASTRRARPRRRHWRSATD